MWPPTISERHTEQLASYRWPQNKSNAIKEKIMLSMRACQDSSSLAKGYDSGPPSLHPWRI